MSSFAKRFIREHPKNEVGSIEVTIGLHPILSSYDETEPLQTHPGLKYIVRNTGSEEIVDCGVQKTDNFWEYWGMGTILEIFRKANPHNLYEYSQAKGISRAQAQAQELKEHYGDKTTIDDITVTE